MVVYPLIGIPIRAAIALGGLVVLLTGNVKWQTLVLAVALWPIAGIGVTAGAHRLWTHGSFKPTTVMEALLIFMFCFSDQGRILDWAITHKAHHRYSDTENDPHNRKRGFWYSHFGWTIEGAMLEMPPHIDVVCVCTRNTRLVKFHDRNSLWLDPLCSLGLPALVASCWGDARGGMLVAGALRWFIVQHFTFFVNSIAHGEPRDDRHTFDVGQKAIGPRVSLLVTFCALGEGWHDYHHAFPWDYAAAELNALDQWNPTKVFIDVCARFGMCSDLRRCSPKRQMAQRLQLELAARLNSRDGEHIIPSQHDGREVNELNTRPAAKWTDDDFDQFEIVGPPFLRSRVLRETKGIEPLPPAHAAYPVGEMKKATEGLYDEDDE